MKIPAKVQTMYMTDAENIAIPPIARIATNEQKT
jgi:hypothetical protein